MGAALAILLLPLLVGGIALLACGRRSKKNNPAGLLFHSVSRESLPGLSHLSTRRFEDFAAFLAASGYASLTVSQALEGCAAEAGARAVVLTFDDGFADFYSDILPILAKCGLLATVFPIVSCVGKKSDWDIYGRRDHLSAAQIRQIAEAGHEIGSHTLTHPNLTFLDNTEARRELLDSRMSLEDISGRRVVSISFPYGNWNGRVWRLAQECGYRFATAYRGHGRVLPGMLRVRGVYAFDTAADISQKVTDRFFFSNARARACVMPHFAKGSSVWRFRSTYRVFRLS